MKRFLLATLTALLLVSGAVAQQKNHLTYGIGMTYEPKVDRPLDQLIDARAKLIARYVLGNHMVWGVSVCGSDDVITGDESSWLTVYVYKDSLYDFAADFDKFATKNHGGNLGVDGITVVVEVIERKPKGVQHEPAKTE